MNAEYRGRGSKNNFHIRIDRRFVWVVHVAGPWLQVCWCVRAHVPKHMRAESPAVRGMWQHPQEVLPTVWKAFKQDWGYLSSGCMSTKKTVGLLTHQL